MNMKDLFADRSPFFQICLLVGAIVFGTIISSLSGIGLFYIIYGTPFISFEDIDAVRWFQLFSSVFSFLMPALLIAWLCGSSLKRYLYIKKTPFLQTWILLLLSIILITPFISLTGYFNKMLQLPAFLEPVQRWMEMQESNAEILTLRMLQSDSILTMLSNLAVIALGAAVCEEFLFRGALFRITGRLFSNPHIVVWSCAFLFSAIHVQFFGFLPRMLLGAYFGYLLVWSKNIWLPVIAHFFNNAMAVILMSVPKLKDNEIITGDISSSTVLPLSIVAFISLYFFYICAIKIKETTSE